MLIVDADPSAATVTGAVVRRIAPDAIVEHEPGLDPEQLRRLGIKPDVLIIDPAAHTFRALHLLRQCKADLPATRVVILASAPTPALRTAARHLDIEAYLEKPATLAKLMEKLRGVLVVEEEVPAAPLPVMQPS
ncbi:MAG TPA: hypothetical protein VGD58_04150 [Herpetosiphonaceae bacterium]